MILVAIFITACTMQNPFDMLNRNKSNTSSYPGNNSIPQKREINERVDMPSHPHHHTYDGQYQGTMDNNMDGQSHPMMGPFPDGTSNATSPGATTTTPLIEAAPAAAQPVAPAAPVVQPTLHKPEPSSEGITPVKKDTIPDVNKMMPIGTQNISPID